METKVTIKRLATGEILVFNKDDRIVVESEGNVAMIRASSLCELINDFDKLLEKHKAKLKTKVNK